MSIELETLRSRVDELQYYWINFVCSHAQIQNNFWYSKDTLRNFTTMQYSTTDEIKFSTVWLRVRLLTAAPTHVSTFARCNNASAALRQYKCRVATSHVLSCVLYFLFCRSEDNTNLAWTRQDSEHRYLLTQWN